MKHRVEKRDSFEIVGISKTVTMVDSQNFKEIPEFWGECCSTGRIANFCNCQGKLGLLGVVYDYNETDKTFQYMIGIEGEEIAGETDTEKLDIPAAEWAIFTAQGKMPDAIQELWGKIFNEFFPHKDYEWAPLPQLEVYPDGNPDSDDYLSEVWIPVVRK